MKTSKSLLLSAAVSGLLLGTAGMSLTSCTKGAETKTPANTPAPNQSGKPVSNTDTTIADKHACKSLNGCEGKGGCKTAANECAGKNSCKGKGGCATAEKHSCKSQNKCKSQGGCKSGDNGCAGKNSCSSKGGCAVPVKH
ncbi:MAG: hypothetical protein IT456_19840 [Planctomycetes bacterium]|nr:hypothetical protein [Planctomycetota bacterium]